MTMLDRMRRHKGWLKWSLALVVLSFIFLYIPASQQTGMPAASGDVVASVEGREITVDRFRSVYNRQMQAYRQAYGANMDERMLKQLGIDQRILEGLIEEEAALAEAGRLGIDASDQEVVARIQSLPAFQENGQFVGETRYRQVLNVQNPPLRPDQFEEQVRRGIVMEKLQRALTDWITVAEPEVDSEFKRRNEKVKLAVINFPADKFREATTATDAEVSAWFESHKSDYKITEKRQGQVRADQHAGPARQAADLRAGRRAALQGEPAAVLHSRTGPRQPHPLQARRQGRGGSAQAGRGGARARQGRRGLRQAREPVHRRGSREDPRRRSRLLRPRPDGEGVRGGGVRAQARPDQRHRQDAVRPAHHQDHRPQARRDAAARGSEGADRRSAEVGAGTERRAAARRGARQADRRSRRLRHGRQGARPDRRRIQLLLQGRAHRRRRDGARGGAARLRNETGRNQQGDPHAAGLRLYLADRLAARTNPGTRRGEGSRCARTS